MFKHVYYIISSILGVILLNHVVDTKAFFRILTQENLLHSIFIINFLLCLFYFAIFKRTFNFTRKEVLNKNYRFQFNERYNKQKNNFLLQIIVLAFVLVICLNTHRLPTQYVQNFIIFSFILNVFYFIFLTYNTEREFKTYSQLQKRIKEEKFE